MILLFNVTLTLPGFAGLILTIGVAADANVVMFERIKEEVRAGKSVRAAIAAGYSKGFHTIVDANVVTAITALVLFAVATASVKGFALMLLIGTVISLITAVAATRAMLGLLAGFRWFDNPRFMGAQGQQSGEWLQIDFMRPPLSLVRDLRRVIVIGFGSLGVQRPEPRHRLQGRHAGRRSRRRSRHASTTSATQEDRDRPERTPSSRAAGRRWTATVQELPGPHEGAERGQAGRAPRALEDKVGRNASGAKNVSSSFGRQIAKSAIIAVLFSLFLSFSTSRSGST